MRTFGEVAKRGSFVRAAEELRYAQSMVTLGGRETELIPESLDGFHESAR